MKKPGFSAGLSNKELMIFRKESIGEDPALPKHIKHRIYLNWVKNPRHNILDAWQKIRSNFLPQEGSQGDPWGGVPREFWGAVRAFHLAKKSQDKTPGVFFHAAFDFDTLGP